MDKFVDAGFTHHLAIGRLWAAHALLISESEILPFDLVQYSNQIRGYFNDFENYYKDMLTNQSISLGKQIKTNHFHYFTSSLTLD